MKKLLESDASSFRRAVRMLNDTIARVRRYIPEAQYYLDGSGGSGQSRGPRQWALRLENGAPWVRAVDSRGRVRLFASYLSAAFAATQLNSEPGFRPWRPAEDRESIWASFGTEAQP